MEFTTKGIKQMIQDTPPKKTLYLTNKVLLPAIIDAKEKNIMTNELANMLQLLCSKYASKGNFVNYTYNDDMQGYAMMMLVRTWKSFDINKSNNPFAFFTQCIKNSFKQYLNLEKRQRTIRDLLLVDQGLNPSYGFQDNDASDQHYVEDEQDFDFYKETAQALQQQLINEDPMFDESEAGNIEMSEEGEQTDEDREDALLM
jgi:DNA-directed RNA polymerase specialized sigma subunit